MPIIILHFLFNNYTTIHCCIYNCTSHHSNTNIVYYICERSIKYKALLCYNNCIVVRLVKSLYMPCISGVPHIVDKMCTLDVWHILCFYQLTKHALVMNLLVWCISSMAQILNSMTNPCANKKVATWQIL